MPATEQRVSLPPRYRVVRHIANGGMASVWAAEDELLGRLVAVKLLSRAYDGDERARRRFLREARAAARLGDCRHVVTVYDIGEHDDRAFMVMEYFAGGTVADRLRDGRHIPRPVALRWLRETAIALDCAHEHDVVHRDVKPANLLIDEHGRLAVGDFGIATVASEASVTLTGQVLGTAAYISPEQARGLPATAASDRYALAVVAFELLAGARPFQVDHPAAQARAHVQATVPAASEARDDLPPAVDAILREGLAKDPDARPASAEDFVDRLEDVLDDDDDAAGPPTAPTRPVRFHRPGGPRIRPARASGAPPPVRPAPAARHSAARPSAARPATARTGARRWSWLAALTALLLAAGAVAAVALTSGGSGSGSGAAKSAQRTTSSGGASSSSRHKRRRAASGGGAQGGKSTSKSTSKKTRRTQSASTASPASTSADPKALNNRGFALIQQGDPASAVTPLRQAVSAFRRQGRTGQIDYAFALYNLATALRATGHPGEAIPLLQERLRVSSYKRDVVERELALARQQAGAGSGSAPAGSNPGGSSPAGSSSGGSSSPAGSTSGGSKPGGAKAKAPKAAKAPTGSRGKGHGDGEGDGNEGRGGGDD